MLFWTLAALLAVMAIAFFVIPFYRANGGDEEAVGSVQRSENLLLFAERESELAEDLAAGEIDSEEHATLLRELQQSLLDDVQDTRPKRAPIAISSRGWLVIGLIAVSLPAVSVTLYQRWGFIDDVQVMGLFQESLAAQGDVAAASALVTELGELVKNGSENPWVWYFLGENFATIGRFNEAEISYRQAAERLSEQPEEALVLGRAALALYIKSEFRFTPELNALIEQAQAINPNEIAVIQLLAADAQNRGDYAAAIANWRILIQLDPNSPEAQALRGEIANAQRLLREESGEEIVGPEIEVRLALAEGLSLDPNLRVFVAVRSAEREGMPPLAAVGLSVADLPTTISLDNSSQVGPFNLSSADLVRVSALVSLNGTANPSRGDYRVVSDDFAHNGQHAIVTLTISDEVE
ncbi:MAG: c-type cytochrome biogenesis protein CcmI [Gammaproteobacteria bacterium]|jgi:cytochrome c-type biogenesis protein CcmH|nr:c-type cytochrome biogenesis protein CcmI [Gammaproteobacteria bacterium]MBT4781348.1 c-type cytochrome biogenesis protein CcmI [Gammaproteobacteria bacterium]MBT5908060.1 c-type cytochrome biogenesis protein CcmI [Gammaproteobacteria bacterium]MBT6315535.1 c-type cytochrome biogenesis protein CcmI [Gammaproteobacteria bacterium]MBT6549308.1 c-type cytochrome biogenesis protein CcmI [Gammaproteobacteria bacterium]